MEVGRGALRSFCSWQVSEKAPFLLYCGHPAGKPQILFAFANGLLGQKLRNFLGTGNTLGRMRRIGASFSVCLFQALRRPLS